MLAKDALEHKDLIVLSKYTNAVRGNMLTAGSFVAVETCPASAVCLAKAHWSRDRFSCGLLLPRPDAVGDDAKAAVDLVRTVQSIIVLGLADHVLTQMTEEKCAEVLEEIDTNLGEEFQHCVNVVKAVHERDDLKHLEEFIFTPQSWLDISALSTMGGILRAKQAGTPMSGPLRHRAAALLRNVNKLSPRLKLLAQAPVKTNLMNHGRTALQVLDKIWPDGAPEPGAADAKAKAAIGDIEDVTAFLQRGVEEVLATSDVEHESCFYNLGVDLAEYDTKMEAFALACEAMDDYSVESRKRVEEARSVFLGHVFTVVGGVLKSQTMAMDSASFLYGPDDLHSEAAEEHEQVLWWVKHHSRLLFRFVQDALLKRAMEAATITSEAASLRRDEEKSNAQKVIEWSGLYVREQRLKTQAQPPQTQTRLELPEDFVEVLQEYVKRNKVLEVREPINLFLAGLLKEKPSLEALSEDVLASLEETKGVMPPTAQEVLASARVYLKVTLAASKASQKKPGLPGGHAPAERHEYRSSPSQRGGRVCQSPADFARRVGHAAP